MKNISKPTTDKKTVSGMIAKIKDRLAFGKLSPEQLTDFTAQKMRLVKSELWK